MGNRIGGVVLLALAWAVPASAQTPQTQEDHPLLLHTLIASQIVLQAADLSTSEYTFGRDPMHYHEANPALRWAQDKPVAMGVSKMSMAVTFSWILLKVHKQHPMLSVMMASLMDAVESAVVWSNHRQLSGVK